MKYIHKIRVYLSAKSRLIASRPSYKRYKNIVGGNGFARFYLAFSLSILLISTVLWSYLGAKIQQSNADQIVNTQLFESYRTFANATLPGAHSFLVKWPLYVLASAFNGSANSLIALTVATALITVGVFGYLLYRIEKRPLIIGTIFLALASVLLMVPAQPYAGGILPVNMAMLATRNIEYILYIVALMALANNPSLKNIKFWISVMILSLLIASDKLFLIFSLGGALLALTIYARSRHWKLASISIDWLSVGLISLFASGFILVLINSFNLTNIASQSTGGPYAFVHSIHDATLGAIYAVSGLFTNFGANPAYDALTIRNIPVQTFKHLTHQSGFAYIVNLVIALTVISVAISILRTSLDKKRSNTIVRRQPLVLSLLLIWSSVAAIGSFVLTDHYYAVDARYLTILLLAGFVSLAAYSYNKKPSADKLAIIGLIIVLSVISAATGALQRYSSEKAATKPIEERSIVISHVLDNHKVDVLVGDYWRVIPAKLASGNKLKVMPLQGCTQPRSTLSSKSWQPNLHKHSFAYVLNLKGGNLTDYPNCTLKQISDVYGAPNSSVLVAGSLSNPEEYLLFYDHGIHKPTNSKPNTQKTATVVPITTDQLTNTTCPVPTDLNIVAHQDDDLLFMNPDILQSIRSGQCVRTLYVTAGDGGNGNYYYLSRQKGAEAAYSSMLGTEDLWIERIVMLPNHQYVTVANPRNNARVSLIFMNLPDGNLKGEGFSASDHASLNKLSQGKIKLLSSLDGQSSYNSSQLIDTISGIMHLYQPSLIRTQASNTGTLFPDHSDHTTVGSYVKKAYKTYESEQYSDQVVIPLYFYIGYPTHERDSNVDGQDLIDKEAAFLAYAKYDGGVCSTLEQCEHTATYGAYLSRQYQNDN